MGVSVNSEGGNDGAYNFVVWWGKQIKLKRLLLNILLYISHSHIYIYIATSML